MARASARPDAISIRLGAIRAEAFEGSFGLTAAENAPWRLSFRERGRAELATPTRVTPLPAGRAVLIAPDISANAKPIGDAHHLLIEFDLSRARDAALLPVHGAACVLDHDATRDHLSRGLLRELVDGAPLGAAACARAQALVHLCLSSVIESSADVEGASHAPAGDARAQLQPALRYIDKHLAELLPNAKLAELAHASESHFIRLFRRTLGRTPARHVQERRVSIAADLLLRTTLSIDEIAERCGFANRYHFSRVFAQRMSNPPGRFRALHADGSLEDTADTPAYGNS